MTVAACSSSRSGASGICEKSIIFAAASGLISYSLTRACTAVSPACSSSSSFSRRITREKASLPRTLIPSMADNVSSSSSDGTFRA